MSAVSQCQFGWPWQPSSTETCWAGSLGCYLFEVLCVWKFIALQDDRQLSGRKDKKEHKGQMFALL